ncbi:E4 SUMO-protein ligase PIAL2-like protein isoform X2 [Tanacetum coccineum]|uniref:E4 SUMO-protein ligase PIAL2-like protein isoform X2 n=1 Tax=Tanacetum coccineum TaxID=301880 RepID=A0ABQ5IU42_9ASTR
MHALYLSRYHGADDLNKGSLISSFLSFHVAAHGACKAGWFSEKDNEELHSLANEIANNFSSAKDMISGESTFHQTVSSVISRFYPGMRMGGVLAFIEATPGYGAYVKDFYMTANAKASNEKVYLFVARTDTTETSSCIVSPQLVNILLNGKPVEKRTYAHTDPGPQLPTHVTDIVRSGTNLLQALGQFNGKYIILVAFMSVGSNPRCPELPDYVVPAAAASDSDNEIIEGPSRISLNCPISFKRINTPVKGHLCKHLRCFDFENYVDINSRIPSWRCPLCGQSVCFTDIRIDQGMVKVLKEVGENVSHVKLSGDGSWLTFEECDDHANMPQDKPPVPQESPTSNADPNIIILAEGDNDMDSNPNQIDKKPTPAQLQAVSMNNVHSNLAPSMMAPVTGTGMNATSQGQSQRSAFNDTKIPAHAILTSSTAMNTISHGQSQGQASASNNVQSPTHAVGMSSTSMNAMSHGQSHSQFFASSTLQLPAYAIGTSSTIMNAMSHGQSQSQVSASNNMQLPRHTTGTCNIAPPMMAPVTGTGMNAISQGQSQNQSQRSAFNDTKIPAHAILTSSTAMNAMSHGQSQSQVSDSNNMQLPRYSTGTSNNLLLNSVLQRQSQIYALNNMQLPTHSAFSAAMDAISTGPSQTYVSSDMQFQQHTLNTMRNDHSGRYPIPARHIPLSPTASTGTVIGDRQQQFYNYHTDQHQTMRMMSSPPSQNMGTQNWVHRDILHVPSQPVQQFSAHSGLPLGHSLNQMLLNSLRQPSQLSPPFHQGIVGPTYGQSTQEVHQYVNVQPLQTSRIPVSMISFEGQRGQVLRATEGSVDAPADQNLQPTGRMRGSLTGRVYSDALRQMIILPTEPVQAASQPVLNTPRPALAPHLHVLLARNGNVYGYLDGASGPM